MVNRTPWRAMLEWHKLEFAQRAKRTAYFPSKIYFAPSLTLRKETKKWEMETNFFVNRQTIKKFNRFNKDLYPSNWVIDIDITWN